MVKLMDENGDRVFDEEGRALYNFKHRHLSLGKYDIVKELGTHSQASTRTRAQALTRALALNLTMSMRLVLDLIVTRA